MFEPHYFVYGSGLVTEPLEVLDTLASNAQDHHRNHY